MRTTILCALTLVCGLARPQSMYADLPVRTEQLIYSVLAWNGSGYSPTFVPEGSESIYLISDEASVLSVRKTLVYYWPPSGRQELDADTLNEPLSGFLEVRNRRGDISRLYERRYTVYATQEGITERWHVATDDQAVELVARFAKQCREYVVSIYRFRRLNDAYLEHVRALSNQIEAERAKGRVVTELRRQMDSLPPPEPPRPPADYLVAPSPVRSGFIVRLPPGAYTVRLLDPGGSTCEGSEKKILTHKARTTAAGIEVVLSRDWTSPTSLLAPSAVLYTNGSSDLYLRPFLEAAFNDLAYARTVDNQGHGSPTNDRWVRMRTGDGPAARAVRG